MICIFKVIEVVNYVSFYSVEVTYFWSSLKDGGTYCTRKFKNVSLPEVSEVNNHQSFLTNSTL